MGGAVPLSWQEIAAWNAATDANLTPWELQVIRRLSSVYCEALMDARAPDCPAPYAEEIDRDAVDEKFRALFSALRRRKRRD
jgi:hypothetical protein